MANFIFSVKCTMPVFLIMCFGYFLKQSKIASLQFIDEANMLCYKLFIPILLFCNVALIDMDQDFDLHFIIVSAILTLVEIAVCIVYTWLFVKPKDIRGTFVGICYRSNISIIGIAFVESIFGQAVYIPQVVISSICFFNISSIIILTLCYSKEKLSAKKLIMSVLKNPIVLGILLGMLVLFSGIKLPTVISKPLVMIKNMTTPLSVICIGGRFSFDQLKGDIKTVIYGSTMKLVIVPAVFIAISAWLGFRGEQLMSLLILFGGPVASACYATTKILGGDGDLALESVALTNLMCTFTITLFVFVLKTLGLL